MKKLSLLIMAVCFTAVAAMAEDVAITETFSRVTNVNTTASLNGYIWIGDVCAWNVTYIRRGGSSDVITISGTDMKANWLSIGSGDFAGKAGKIETTNLEGGIKAVSFPWAQFGAEASNTLKLKVSAGDKIDNPAVTRDGSLGANRTTGGETYSKTFECKANEQLVIENVSDMVGSNACRILVGNITITPYLLYRNKVITIGLKQQGFVNNNIVNNTGEEGTISYKSSDETVAKVDAETGVITPIAVGNAIITATWSEGASTSYTVYVEDGIVVENFGKVNKLSQVQEEATWHGDLFDWNVLNTRRGYDDTLGLSPRIQATALRKVDGKETYIYSNEPVEGGIKNITFDWRQWASGTSPLTISAYYSADKESWGTAVAVQEEDAVKASEPHVFNKDIDANGTAGNAYLKIGYTSGAGHAVIGAIKITPWLLYTKKAASIDLRLSETSYKNEALIDHTSGEAIVYSLSENTIGATIDPATGVVTAGTKAGVVTITAKWKNVSTSYELTILADTPSGIEEVGSETVSTVRSEKKLIDGQLVIIREGKKYNAQGTAL